MALNPENSNEKAPYKKPEITSEKIFEQNALACAKCASSPSMTILGACSRGLSKKS